MQTKLSNPHYPPEIQAAGELVKLRESGGSSFDRNPNMVWNVTKDEIEKMRCYLIKGSISGVLCPKFIDLYNFSGPMILPYYWSFKG